MVWYVVFRGRNPGVYREWQDCNDQVCGFPNCSFRSYPSRDEAMAVYLAYFKKQESAGSGSQVGAYNDEIYPVVQVVPPAAVPLQAGENEADGPPAVADPDIGPVLVILIALFLVVVAYFLN